MESDRSVRRNFLFGCTSIAIAIAAVLLTAEVLLRFLPVSSGLRTRPVNSGSSLFHFESNRDSVYSSGWNLRHATRVHVNNAGFVNDVDYDASLDSPLLAVIGDSYVEALMVPDALTLQGCLAQWVGPHGRVYSFGASGAPLSQYLAWAGYVAQTYRPDAIVFVVIGNDFDESLMRYKRGPGFHHFRARGNQLTLELVPYDPSPWRNLVYSSALGRYLVFNLQLPSIGDLMQLQWQRLIDSEEAESLRHVGNAEAEASEERLMLSSRAVDAFLSGLEQIGAWKPEQVIFVVDAIRPFVYDGRNAEIVRSSYVARMRDYLISRANHLGHTVVDLHPVFEGVHRSSALKFEFPDDAHWNEHGHRVAAQEIARLGVFRTLFDLEGDELKSTVASGCSAVAEG